ncbi:hypothetical protein Plhal304r1_c013g0050131 [Plasmopara halstedii]
MLFKKALEEEGRLILVEDMLSSTELDTVELLKAILRNQDRVQLFKEALKNEEHLKLFRLALDNRLKFPSFMISSMMRNSRKSLMQHLRMLTVIFFSKWLSRMICIDQKKLTNVFRSILKEEEQLDWLKNAVHEDIFWQVRNALDMRDRKMLIEEAMLHLETTT